MIFWRVLDDKLYAIDEVDKLGFETEEGLRIPDEYLDNQEFVILRTCHGIGDWGIIASLPRLLKAKYPNCKVYVPSKNLIKKLFNIEHNNAHVVFDNNPYVDDFVDNVSGEIFHDHYRIYDKNNTDVPLAKQMLKFWQFSDSEMEDYLPEMYWTDDEKKFGDKIIKEYIGDNDFGCLLMADRFGTQSGKQDDEFYKKDTRVMIKVLKDYDIPFLYWTTVPIADTPFDFINKKLDLRNIDLRIQLYIKSCAKVNVSNQCGTNHIVARYSECYESQRQYPIEHNFIDNIKYI